MKKFALLVLVLIVLAAAAALADQATFTDLPVADQLDNVAPAREVALAPPAAVELPQLSLRASPAAAPVILPPDVELSTFIGAALPGMTGGGMISFPIVATADGSGRGFVDLGLAIVEAKPLALIAGLSIALGKKPRAGVGPYYMIEDGRFGVCLYARLPLGSTDF